MEAGGGVGRRRGRAPILETEEEKVKREAVSKFYDTLHSGKSGYELSLVQRIAVGDPAGPRPIVYDLDWCPRPALCKGKDAVAILACLSSFGLHIYYCPRTTLKWTTIIIKHRPYRPGSCLRWHPLGTALACSTDPSDGMHGKLTTLIYDKNHLHFAAKHEFQSKHKISSLVWILATGVLVCSFFSKASLKFFRFIGDGALIQMYERNCEGFPSGSAISLQEHPSGNYFFAASDKASTILVWGVRDGGYNILHNVNCSSEVNGLSFSKPCNSLISLHENHWKCWQVTGQNDLSLTFTSINGHQLVMGKDRKWRSNLMSLSACLRAKLVASGGSGDTFLAYANVAKYEGNVRIGTEWIPVCSRKANFTFGEVRSIKFNPQDITSLRLATGGITGIIHLWECKRTHIRRNVFPARCLEYSYYNRNLNIASYIPTQYAEADGFVVESATEEVEVEYDEGQDEEEKIELDNKLRLLGRVRRRVKRGVEADQGSEDQASNKFNLVAVSARHLLGMINDGNVPPTEHVKLLCERIRDLELDKEFNILLSSNDY